MSSNTCNDAPEKIGLDDFCVRERKNAAKAFFELPEEDYAESKELWKLHARLAFVDAVNATYDFETKRFYKSKNDLVHMFADQIVKLQKNDGGFKEVNAAELWLKWLGKQRYKDVCYAPGHDSVANNKINLWPGWGCEPKKGSVKEFNNLLDYIFKDEPALREWFVKWLAYPIQNPGEKNLTAVLLHSEAQGVGKSFIGYIMGGIYGKNFVVIDSEAMKGNFNGWAVNKQFILGEEITGSNARNFSDRFKNMVTREQIHVNEKYQPEYDIEDCANYLLTSNHDDALFIENSDRRNVVHNIKSAPREFDFYKRIDTWRENGGPEHVFNYLLNEVNLEGYDPKQPAPSTKDKEEMIALSKSDLDLAMMQIRDNPDDILRGANLVNACPLLTTTQIASFVNTYTGGRSTLIAVSKALRRAKFRQEQINVVDGCHKVWAVRDMQRLGRLDASEWVAIYNDFHPQKKF